MKKSPFKFKILYLPILLLAWCILGGWNFKHPLGIPTPTLAVPTQNIQYVCVAFDGAGMSPFWEESLSMAKKHNATFTYFVSGVFLLSPQSKFPERHSKTYQGPEGSLSKIGWGTSDTEINQLISYLKKAQQEGHEIGSHAMGHLHGSKWSEAQWDQELNAFQRVWLDVLKFPTANLHGFRSPYLEKNPAMYRSLKKLGYVYDTSATARMDTWPTRNAMGVWVFPLAEIPIADTKGRTISMDYNFLFYDVRRPKRLKETRAIRKNRILQSYRNYFYHNYHGSRAPVHIGHHFQNWSGNIYQEALWEFIAEISKLPEVKLVSYRELAQILEQKNRLRVFKNPF
jgi:peptidoglycan/xylan/chitin deacetylase (PgdA/CDA1 family)